MTMTSYTKAIDRLNEIMQQLESGEIYVDALTTTLKEARQLLT
ncbi:MAG: exodeoxyribonuclease VII small subunit, partial [Bacteroidaceae bacterium]|nr:exodeoxyribonuclease VII small subunit [Bacteroidaceae bacterium]